jgi:hypothetical protein
MSPLRITATGRVKQPKDDEDAANELDACLNATEWEHRRAEIHRWWEAEKLLRAVFEEQQPDYDAQSHEDAGRPYPNFDFASHLRSRGIRCVTRVCEFRRDESSETRSLPFTIRCAAPCPYEHSRDRHRRRVA